MNVFINIRLSSLYFKVKIGIVNYLESFLYILSMKDDENEN